MTVAFNLAEAKAHFSELLRRIEEGEDIVLARGGEPIARAIKLAKET